MTERIKELIEQATVRDYWSVDQGRYIVDFVDQEKFAKLIIKECESVSISNSRRDDDMGAIIARKITQHFGVEE